MSDLETLDKDLELLTGRVREQQAICIKAAQNEDIETLSLTLMKLANTNSRLGRKGKLAMWVARTAEQAYKAAREQYKLDAIDAKKTASYGDTQRYIKSTPDHKVWADALLVAEQAEDLAYRTSDFMKYAQSRLSLMKVDIHRG